MMKAANKAGVGDQVASQIGVPFMNTTEDRFERHEDYVKIHNLGVKLCSGQADSGNNL